MMHRSKATVQAFREAMQMVDVVALCIAKAAAVGAMITTEALIGSIAAAQQIDPSEIEKRIEGN
jgi:hypothetical protein